MYTSVCPAWSNGTGLGRGQVVIAEAERHDRNVGVSRRLHVEGRIADHGEASSSQGQDRGVDHVRGGFGAAGAERVAAEDQLEAIHHSQRAQQLARVDLDLVGDHRQLAAAFRQRVEGVEAAGIRHGVVGDVRLVMCEELAVGRFELGLGQGAAGQLHRPFEHAARAAADQLDGGVGRDRGAA